MLKSSVALRVRILLRQAGELWADVRFALLPRGEALLFRATRLTDIPDLFEVFALPVSAVVEEPPDIKQVEKSDKKGAYNCTPGGCRGQVPSQHRMSRVL